MAVIISKHCADMLVGGKAVVNETYGPGDGIISFGDGTGTGGNDEIIAAAGTPFSGFHVGDMVTTVTKSTTNDGTFEVLDVTGGGAAIEVPAGSFTTEAAATVGLAVVATARGHSLADIFKYGVIRIYSGSQPASPQEAETGTLLLEISESGGAFVADADANGLLWDAYVDGVLSKDGSQTWSGAGIATGTAGWGRVYDNGFDTGADAGEAFNRIDFSVGTTGADLTMATAVTIGNTKTIDSFDLIIPLSA